MQRQSVLTGEQAPALHAIIHEAALHASFGSPEIMRDQLLRLIELSRLPNVTIQVLPFHGPVAFGSSFTLVEPNIRELSTVIVAHVEESLYLGDVDALARYNEWFDRMSELALPPVDATISPERHGVMDSLGLIQRLLWQKSSFSEGHTETCVEVASMPHAVAVRDSTDPDGPVLTFRPEAFAAFVAAAATGEFRAAE
ncbi:DUF397 domain-containing protein [Streptomyces sp. 8N616]|uniref:DUF397 domain-containing protein n=1 Tax=Streptomyces sp. 8N616 TaxID=3457414 RepID=UPI003FD2C834